MAHLEAGSPEVSEIDQAMAQWRQGDLAIDEDWFVHIADPKAPLTEETAQATGRELMNIMSEVAGLAVVSQTCDLVRTCLHRPFVQVAPLVEVTDNDLKQIRRGYRPQYAYLPAVADQNLVIDLDRVMTLEKSIVASWDRTPGWQTDADSRRLAEAMGRKRLRPAFPDDFVHLAGALQDRLRSKHDKNSPEGFALRALRETRIRASPSWDSQQIEIFLWFIEGESTKNTIDWEMHLTKWLGFIRPAGRFTTIDGVVMKLEDMTAQEYIESDRLDLDHLSSREPER